MLKDKYHKSSWIKNKKLILTFGLLLLVLAAVFVAKPIYDEYHDRPLTAGVQYIGRDYHTGCVPMFGCFGPTTEYLYYSTNISPRDLVSSFSGWKLAEVSTGKTILWDREFESESEYYTISNTTSQQSLTYIYIKDKNLVSRVSKLLPTDKKYIIQIDKDDYTMLRKS